MKKVAFTMCIILNSGLIAADTDILQNLKNSVYVGMDVGSMTLKTTSDYRVNVPDLGITNSGSSTSSSSANAKMLKIGYHFNPNHRVAAFYQKMTSDNAKASMYGIGYDYLIGEYSLKPFLGIFLERNNIQENGNNSDFSGMGYGAQVGVNYAFNTHFSIETGYRFMKLNMEQSVSYNDTAYGYPSNLTEKTTMDDIKNLFLGINYKF